MQIAPLPPPHNLHISPQAGLTGSDYACCQVMESLRNDFWVHVGMHGLTWIGGWSVYVWWGDGVLCVCACACVCVCVGVCVCVCVLVGWQ